MNDDQQYDAAEREMDLYRAENTRITAERDEARGQLTQMRYEHGQAIGVNENLRAQLAALRKGIRELATDLTASAAVTRPSRKSDIENETAIALRKLLEDQ